MDDGIAMEGKPEAADAIVAVKYDGIALCGIGRSEVKHTHIHTNSADYLAHSAEIAVRRVDRDLVSRRVAENAVGVADSDSRGVDLLFNAVGAAVSELLALGETVNSRDLGAELEGGLESEIDSRRGTESEKRNADARRVCKILRGAGKRARAVAKMNDSRINAQEADAIEGIKESDGLKLRALP